MNLLHVIGVIGLVLVPSGGLRQQNRNQDKGAAAAQPATAQPADEAKSSKKPTKAPRKWVGIECVAVTSDGRWVFAGRKDQGRATLFDLTEKKRHDFTLPDQADTTITAVAVRQDGRFVATGHDDVAILWDVQTGKTLGKPIRLAAPVRSLVFTPNGKQLLTAAANGSLQTWDLNTQAKAPFAVRVPSVINTVVFSPNGQTIAAACQDKTARLWKLDGEAKAVLHHDQPVTAVRFRNDGQRLVTGCVDGTVRRWEAATGVPLGRPRKHRERVYDVVYYAAGNAEQNTLIVSAGGNATFQDAKDDSTIAIITHATPMQSVVFGWLLTCGTTNSFESLKTLFELDQG